MEYKGERKFYFEMEICDDWARFRYKRFIFRLFFLIKRNPQGEILKFGRDYIGINYKSNGWEASN